MPPLTPFVRALLIGLGALFVATAVLENMVGVPIVSWLALDTHTLALQTLRTNGRLAAFQLDLVSGGVEYVLKIGYEPELGNLSPGALLMRRTIEKAAASGLQIVDLLGDDMPWKRDWTKDMRPHVRLLAFGKGPAGVALSALEFGALPRLREMRDRLQSKKNSSGGTA